MEKEIRIKFEEFEGIDDLNETDRLLCDEAVKALQTSHSPYSKFKVGTALLLQSGRVIHGSNQENAAYPSGLCAERVALFQWGNAHTDDPIIAMATTAHTDEFRIEQPVTSCGACLQVMAEYEKKQHSTIRFLLYCQGGKILVTQGVKSFLPFLFFEERLK